MLDKIKNSLTPSINQSSDLIIGQYFFLTLTLLFDKTPSSSLQVTFTTTTKNIILLPGDLGFSPVPGQSGKYTCTLMLQVANATDKPIKDNDGINFTVALNPTLDGISPLEFTCKAKKINSDSLGLNFDSAFLNTPNIKKPSKDIKAKVFTTLMDSNGQALSNVPIFIDSVLLVNLKSCIIRDEPNGNVIPVEKYGTYEGLFINSQEDGSVVFYIYPQQSYSMVLELRTSIFNVFDLVSAASPLFIVDTEVPNPMDSLREPEILGGYPGPLRSPSGDSDFYVSVDNYAGSARGDYILFFVKKSQDTDMSYTGHFVTVENPNTELGQNIYSYHIPYDIFDIDISYDFSYIVVYGKGTDSKASRSQPVTYIGGATYYPQPGVNRNYDICKVYTSRMVELLPGSVIGYASIKKYLDNPNNNTGLFIKIDGAQNQQGKVPLGYNVTLYMYVNMSDTGIKKHWSQLMPTTVNSNNIATWSYNIPLEILRGLNGTIYFDYELSIGGTVFYGKVWEGLIDTIPE